MNLISTAFLWLCFAFCLSMTAAGILVLFRVGRQQMGSEYPLLQAAFILVSVFGYYGLWPR
ncbi:MAG: hypothetical protein KDI28_12400, partial [Pseudomonadales bacterium]|nr:hypothetical protein [Pseudomonadales bacterium]